MYTINRHCNNTKRVESLQSYTLSVQIFRGTNRADNMTVMSYLKYIKVTCDRFLLTVVSTPVLGT